MTIVTDEKRTSPPRRQVLETSWVIGVVVFVMVRFLVAYSTLAQYGRTTVIVFGVLDIATAVPYALGTARLVTGMVDRRYRDALRWATVACASFLAPYLWLAWAGRESFPMIAYLVIVVLAILLGANAAMGIARRVRVARLGAGEMLEPT